MTTIWHVGDHWYVGSPTHNATAIEATIGMANEFTFGDYNFFCAGFYLDATVGPLVELIAPFPYSVFGGTLIEVIIPQSAAAAATLMAAAAAAAVGVITEEASNNPALSVGVGAAVVGAGAFAAATAAEAAGTSIAAIMEAFPLGYQQDIVYGNYFFTVYGDTHETVLDDNYTHNGLVHFHHAQRLLHSVAGASEVEVLSELVVARNGITISAVDEFNANSSTVELIGSVFLHIAATADLTLSGSEVQIGANAVVRLNTPTANIVLTSQGVMACNAATIFIHNDVHYIEAPFALPVAPYVMPTAEIAAAMANLDVAVAAVAAAAGHGHGH